MGSAGVVYVGAGLALLAALLRDPSEKSVSLNWRIAAVRIKAGLAIVLLSACRQPRRVSQGASQLVAYGCGSCHTIAGIAGAHGLVGPSLAGLGSRIYVAGSLPNQSRNLVFWIRNPQLVNPKTAMPNLGVSEENAQDIVSYLYSLK